MSRLCSLRMCGNRGVGERGESGCECFLMLFYISMFVEGGVGGEAGEWRKASRWRQSVCKKCKHLFTFICLCVSSSLCFCARPFLNAQFLEVSLKSEWPVIYGVEWACPVLFGVKWMCKLQRGTCWTNFEECKSGCTIQSVTCRIHFGEYKNDGPLQSVTCRIHFEEYKTDGTLQSVTCRNTTVIKRAYWHTKSLRKEIALVFGNSLVSVLAMYYKYRGNYVSAYLELFRLQCGNRGSSVNVSDVDSIMLMCPQMKRSA